MGKKEDRMKDENFGEKIKSFYPDNSNLSKTRHNPAGTNVNEALTGAEVRILFVYGWFTIEITSLFCFISS